MRNASLSRRDAQGVAVPKRRAMLRCPEEMRNASLSRRDRLDNLNLVTSLSQMIKTTVEKGDYVTSMPTYYMLFLCLVNELLTGMFLHIFLLSCVDYVIVKHSCTITLIDKHAYMDEFIQF